MFPSLRRYKTGFDRLGIVLLVPVAAAFGLIVLLSGEPYVAPTADSEAGLALAAEIEARCTDVESEPLAAICEEQVMSEDRFRHYREAFALDGWGLLVAVPAALGCLAFLVWGAIWTSAAFRRPEDFEERS